MKNDAIAEVRQINKDMNAETMLSLENLIKQHIEGIDKLKDELKAKREMFNDSFVNNPIFKEHDEKAKEAAKIRTSTKQQIAKEPSVAKINQQIKDLVFDLKERKKTLSDLLFDYKQQTKATQLELFSGQIVEIVESATIVRKRAK